jgi:hypothetical protein
MGRIRMLWRLDVLKGTWEVDTRGGKGLAAPQTSSRRFVMTRRNDAKTSDWLREMLCLWSAAARGRFGWARRDVPKESGDPSPQSKMSNLQGMGRIPML